MHDTGTEEGFPIMGIEVKTQINTYTYGHLIFDKENRTIQWKKRIIFKQDAALLIVCL